jgi:hypothetical protein
MALIYDCRWFEVQSILTKRMKTQILTSTGTMIDDMYPASVARVVLGWLACTGVFLTGPSTLLLVVALAYWNDDARKYVPTVTYSMERWPYATTLVLGVGVSSIFAAEVVCLPWHRNYFQTCMAYVAMVAMWGVFGTCTPRGVAWVDDMHTAVTAILLLSTMAYSLLSVRSAFWEYSCVSCVILAMMLCSLASCVGASVFLFTPGRAEDAYVFWHEVLAVSELTYLLEFSVLMGYVFMVYL